MKNVKFNMAAFCNCYVAKENKLFAETFILSITQNFLYINIIHQSKVNA